MVGVLAPQVITPRGPPLATPDEGTLTAPCPSLDSYNRRVDYNYPFLLVQGRVVGRIPTLMVRSQGTCGRDGLADAGVGTSWAETPPGMDGVIIGNNC